MHAKRIICQINTLFLYLLISQFSDFIGLTILKTTINLSNHETKITPCFSIYAAYGCVVGFCR